MMIMILRIRKPISGGIILSYRCTGECKHCMYACSPRWSNDWIDLNSLNVILSKLAQFFSEVYPKNAHGVLGINYGLHFTGGEPFLNYDLLLKAVKIAKEKEIPGIFVETNCFWCIDDSITEERFKALKDVGLDGVLISANPFVVEHVPFGRIKRAFRIACRVYGEDNVMVYHPIFFRQLLEMGIDGTMSFEEYLTKVLRYDKDGFMKGFNPGIILPMGRLPYRIGYLYKHYPARYFFKESCLDELTRPWHIHIDCYYNYIPGYCGGISLGDAREIDKLVVEGIDLDDRPILKALVANLGELYDFAVKEFGYKERKEGYISKCHLCVDIRRHIALETSEFKELRPREYYIRLI